MSCSPLLGNLIRNTYAIKNKVTLKSIAYQGNVLSALCLARFMQREK
jgi:hypothetical protein